MRVTKSQKQALKRRLLEENKRRSDAAPDVRELTMKEWLLLGKM